MEEEQPLNMFEVREAIDELQKMVDMAEQGKKMNSVEAREKVPKILGPIMELLARAGDCSLLMFIAGPSYLRMMSAGEPRGFASSKSGYDCSNKIREDYNARTDRALDQGATYCPWPEEISSIIEEAKCLNDELKQLIEIVERYEEFGPPHGKCGIFGQFNYPSSPHLPGIPIPLHRLSACISEPFPTQFWDLEHILHSVWHPLTFLGWIHQQYFLDPETKVMWGGKGGIRWIVFSLVRMVLQIDQKKKNLGTGDDELNPGVMASVETYVGACCDVVIHQVQGSIAILSRANRARQMISEDQMAYGEPPIPYLRNEPEMDPVPASPAKSFRFKSPLEEGSSATPMDEIRSLSTYADGFSVNAIQKSPTRSILKRSRSAPDSSPIQPNSAKRSRPDMVDILDEGLVFDDSDVEEETDDVTPSTSSTGQAGTSADKGKKREKLAIVEDEEGQEATVVVPVPPKRGRVSRRLPATRRVR